MIYAIWLEQRFSKDEILELYLNRVYFGGGTYGVEAAARRYFGKSARAVTLTQAALLAGLLKAPSRYAPTRNVELATARVDVVLDNMVEAGFLTTAEARGCRRRAAAAPRLRRRDGISLRRRLGGETLPDFVGEHRRRSDRRDHHRCRSSARRADDAAPEARRGRQGRST